MNVTSDVGIASKKIQAYFVALQTQSIDAGSGAGRLTLPDHMFIAFKKLFFFFCFFFEAAANEIEKVLLEIACCSNLLRLQA